MQKKWIVVTTINKPTAAIESISKLAGNNWSAVVVGDRKTPADWSAPNIYFLSVEEQRDLFGSLADLVPYNHYCRKNLGYLFAISHGAECILETDDDNIPYRQFGEAISNFVSGKSAGRDSWINVYRYFTEDHIWPRGLPLNEIESVGQITSQNVLEDCPVQQYLADLDPDVDAVYRLVINKEVTFDRNPSLVLDKGSWSPFNSQNTLFFRNAFPLLYLPCHVTFRMTDIWRSFVAQQALWIFGYRLAFHHATVKQLRNAHDLMSDFKDEIPGYLDNKKICKLLADRAEKLSPSMGMTAVSRALWESLSSAGIIPDVEMNIIDCWFKSLSKAMGG